MRVKSRKPLPALLRYSALSWRDASSATRADASRCGRWETAARIRSCRAGSSRAILAPQAVQNCATSVERCIAGFGTGAFVACDRMPRNELRQPTPEGFPRGQDHVLLGASRVGDDGSLVQRVGKRCQHAAILRDGYRDQDEIGARDLVRPSVVEHEAAIDGTARKRPIEIRARAANADDRSDGAGRTQGQCARRADQSDANDDQFIDAHARCQRDGWGAPPRVRPGTGRFQRACPRLRGATSANRSWRRVAR